MHTYRDSLGGRGEECVCVGWGGEEAFPLWSHRQPPTCVRASEEARMGVSRAKLFQVKSPLAHQPKPAKSTPGHCHSLLACLVAGLGARVLPTCGAEDPSWGVQPHPASFRIQSSLPKVEYGPITNRLNFISISTTKWGAAFGGPFPMMMCWNWVSHVFSLAAQWHFLKPFFS